MLLAVALDVLYVLYLAFLLIRGILRPDNVFPVALVHEGVGHLPLKEESEKTEEGEKDKRCHIAALAEEDE